MAPKTNQKNPQNQMLLAKCNVHSFLIFKVEWGGVPSFPAWIWFLCGSTIPTFGALPGSPPAPPGCDESPRYPLPGLGFPNCVSQVLAGGGHAPLAVTPPPVKPPRLLLAPQPVCHRALGWGGGASGLQQLCREQTRLLSVAWMLPPWTSAAGSIGDPQRPW